MHGGPHTMWTDHFVVRWNYHLLAQPGYVVLLTNYTGSTGFGEKFAQGIQFDPLEGPANEINEAADEAIKRFAFIDATRQAAGGASYGGHLANWMAVTTTRYKALVSHAGLFDLAQQWGTSDTIYGRERNVGGPPWEGSRAVDQTEPAAARRQYQDADAGDGRRARLPRADEQRDPAVERPAAHEGPGPADRVPRGEPLGAAGENSRFFYNEVHAWLGAVVEIDSASRCLNAGGDQAHSN